MNNPLTIVFCLPGNSFSGQFLDCWTHLVAWCRSNNIKMILSRHHSCNIYYVRNMCLGGDITRGRNQKPFNGRIDYDYLMWIDSDITFSNEQFQALLDHKLDIVSGIYVYTSQNDTLACGVWENKAYPSVEPDTLESLKNRNRNSKGLLEVDYCGFGFILIKKGVFESMQYPWFRPLIFEIDEARDQMTDDLGWCYQIKEIGYNIYVDPEIRVKHEKRALL